MIGIWEIMRLGKRWAQVRERKEREKLSVSKQVNIHLHKT